MRRALPVFVVALVCGAGLAQISIYQWSYDRLPLGPDFHAHIFALNLDANATGLVLELSGAPEQVEWLVFGGALYLNDPPTNRLHLAGSVAPGGLVVVALPAGVRPLRAAWLTAAGDVPIDVVSPIPRVHPEDLMWTADTHLVAMALDLWPPDLANWASYPCLVRLSARNSFSPVGEEIVTWTWIWKDGVVQEGPEVVRGFQYPGWYRFTLTVCDASSREQQLRSFVFASPIWELVWLRTKPQVPPAPAEEKTIPTPEPPKE